MEEPNATAGEFKLLKVVAITGVGAFLDCGSDKDLLLPFAEQSEDLRVGDEIIVHVYLDNTDRLCASMRLEKFLEKTSADYKEQQEVELFIYRKTDLGYKAIVNGKTIGVLFDSNVFQPLKYGQKIKGYINKLRPDGKIDLLLSQAGHKSADDIGPLILKMLSEQDSFLAINDKTPPETIYKLFGVSKKKYKMVLGGLYKQHLITVHEDGIRLVKPSQPNS